MPQNVEAELSVLGAILLNPSVVDDVIDVLGKRPHDVFHVEAHQLLYGAMLRLHGAGTPIDTVTLMEALGKRLEAAGGVSYIASMTSKLPTSANFEHYARMVKETATLRKMIHSCRTLAERCYNLSGEGVEDIIGAAQAIFENMDGDATSSKAVHIMDVIETVVSDVDRFLKSEQSPGVPTPLGWLNDLIGGLPYGELSMLLARPNVGKTAMMLNIAHHAAGLGIPVMILSLEMRKEKLAERLLNIDGGVDFKRIEKRWQVDAEIQKLTTSAGRVGNLNIWINDASVMTAADIRATAKKFERTQGRGLILVDYLQYVTTPRMDKPHVEIGEVVHAFSKIPKDTGHHLLSLGQLSRDADSLKTGYEKFNKGAGSSEIEKSTDIGFVLHAPKVKEKKDMAAQMGCDVSHLESCFHLTVAKNRNGPTGDAYVRFMKERQRFYEVTGTKEEPVSTGDPNDEVDEENIPF